MTACRQIFPVFLVFLETLYMIIRNLLIACDFRETVYASWTLDCSHQCFHRLRLGKYTNTNIWLLHRELLPNSQLQITHMPSYNIVLVYGSIEQNKSNYKVALVKSMYKSSSLRQIIPNSVSLYGIHAYDRNGRKGCVP